MQWKTETSPDHTQNGLVALEKKAFECRVIVRSIRATVVG